MAKSQIVRSLPAVVLVAAVSSATPAQIEPSAVVDVRVGNAAADPRAIRWHLPGDFERALERARREHRLLMIKGISFGIDEAGAKCATKGRW